MLKDKAYEAGKRMGEYIAARDGADGAMRRGSLAHVRYSREALRKAYNDGYSDAVCAKMREGWPRDLESLVNAAREDFEAGLMSSEEFGKVCDGYARWWRDGK